MKKITSIIVLLLAITAVAEHVDVPFSRRDIRIDLQDTRTSTVSIMSTLPVIVNGKAACTYLGSISEAPDEELNCPETYIYHLVRIAENKGKLDCYYDYNRDWSPVVTVTRVDRCPDILASHSGFRFFDAVNFDDTDDHRFYYIGMEIPKQQIDWSLSDDYRVRDQIKYRRVNFPSAKSKRKTIDW